MKTPDLVNFLKLIYSEGRISRTSLAEKTGLVPSYITTVVRDLQAQELLIEAARAPSGRGSTSGRKEFRT